MTLCERCGEVTPHKEDPVPNPESATVWHCLCCGNEQRPNEPGSPNEPAKPVRPVPRQPDGKELILV